MLCVEPGGESNARAEEQRQHHTSPNPSTPTELLHPELSLQSCNPGTHHSKEQGAHHLPSVCKIVF